MIKNAIGMIGSDAGGMWKCLVILVSIVKPCWTEKVWSCAKQSVIMTVQQNMGIILRIILAFSTCVTLQSFHGLRFFCFSDCASSDFLSMAALSKNLCKKMHQFRTRWAWISILWCQQVVFNLFLQAIQYNLWMQIIAYMETVYFIYCYRNSLCISAVYINKTLP
jgi:hypothetical protein